jgi:phosphatidate cytidylyltransferase
LSNDTISIALSSLFVALSCWTISSPGKPIDVILLCALVVLFFEVLVRAKSLADSSTSVVAGLYVGVPLGMLVALHQVGGPSMALFLIGTIVVSDVAQYYSGKLFGKHLLAPEISPKKTIEGAIGGLLFGVVFVVLVGEHIFPFVKLALLIPMAVAIVLLGICGDLFESRLKRSAGVKDSGTIIPGHGGLLDRLDALLFATPGFYFFINQLM